MQRGVRQAARRRRRSPSRPAAPFPPRPRRHRPPLSPAAPQAIAGLVPEPLKRCPNAKMFLRSFWYRATQQGVVHADEMHIYTVARCGRGGGCMAVRWRLGGWARPACVQHGAALLCGWLRGSALQLLVWQASALPRRLSRIVMPPSEPPSTAGARRIADG